MDLTVSYKNISDESVLDVTGSVKKYKRFDFFLGAFGPFVERFDLETFTDAQVIARIAALKATLTNLPT
jgi:hypothetical protein